MAIITVDKLTVLKPAAELAQVAKTAKEGQQLMRIAHALNTAANTGETSIQFNGEQMYDSVKAKLEKEGYVVRFIPTGTSLNYHISYNKTEEKK